MFQGLLRSKSQPNTSFMNNHMSPHLSASQPQSFFEHHRIEQAANAENDLAVSTKDLLAEATFEYF